MKTQILYASAVNECDYQQYSVQYKQYLWLIKHVNKIDGQAYICEESFNRNGYVAVKYRIPNLKADWLA